MSLEIQYSLRVWYFIAYNIWTDLHFQNPCKRTVETHQKNMPAKFQALVYQELFWNNIAIWRFYAYPTVMWLILGRYVLGANWQIFLDHIFEFGLRIFLWNFKVYKSQKFAKNRRLKTFLNGASPTMTGHNFG